MSDIFDLEPFIQSLIETVVWCRHHLKEDDNPDILWTVTDEQMRFSYLDNTLVEPFYYRVIAARSAQVARLPIPEYEDILPLMQQGRFAIFLYTCTTADTAAGIVSQGFFDPFNSPPWATWVYHVEPLPNFAEYIIAWIPSQFIDQAGNGIDVCSDESILWLTDERLDIPFKAALEAAHLWL
jgi:hypothetical protein